MNADVAAAFEKRGVTRLCHFTPSRNLAHIATGEIGILSTKQLKDNERRVFTQTDLERLDGHETHISCSVQYPNAWFFDRARVKDTLFRDWVILFIDPGYIAYETTLFCPRNAAAGYGKQIVSGVTGFESMYASSVRGARNVVYTRTALRLPYCPTDEQAEVLVPDAIDKVNILGIGVVDIAQAKNEIARLQLLGLPRDSFQFIVSPDLFDKNRLKNFLALGKTPTETPYA